MRKALTVITPPAAYPITRDEAAEWVHLDPSNVSEDVVLDMLIATSTEQIEKYLGRALITQVLEMEFMPHPPEILPMRIYLWRAAPLQSIQWVKSIEQDGTEHTQATNIYDTDIWAIPGRIQLLMGYWWDYFVFGKYRIRYTCGYGDDASDVPAAIKTAILMYVSQLYQSREEMDYSISPQVEVLLQDYKLDTFDFTDSGAVKWSPFGSSSVGYGYR